MYTHYTFDIALYRCANIAVPRNYAVYAQIKEGMLQLTTNHYPEL